MRDQYNRLLIHVDGSVAKILKMLTSSNMISTYKTPDCNSVTFILFLFPHSPDQQYNSLGWVQDIAVCITMSCMYTESWKAQRWWAIWPLM